MARNPLAEVFGFPIDNLSEEAERYRTQQLCPYHNKVPKCTKNSAKKPLGVCSIHEAGGFAITCPIRLRQDWKIISDAERFFARFVPPGTMWTALQEVRLNDANGKSAGNIDFVLVAYDEQGKIINFGSIEVQTVYISGNVTEPFGAYMRDRSSRNAPWTDTVVRADYLSSSRKRLVPQMLFKGHILQTWGKKQAIVLHTHFFETLPKMPVIQNPDDADIVWLIYDFEEDKVTNRYRLVLVQTIYTQFKPAIDSITIPDVGTLEKFTGILQRRLNKLQITPPVTPTITENAIIVEDDIGEYEDDEDTEDPDKD